MTKALDELLGTTGHENRQAIKILNVGNESVLSGYGTEKGVDMHKRCDIDADHKLGTHSNDITHFRRNPL